MSIQQEYDHKQAIQDWRVDVLDDLETKPIAEWDYYDVMRMCIIGYLPIVDSND